MAISGICLLVYNFIHYGIIGTLGTHKRNGLWDFRDVVLRDVIACFAWLSSTGIVSYVAGIIGDERMRCG